MHDETFLITKGTIRFSTGQEDHDAGVGDYVVVPPKAVLYAGVLCGLFADVSTAGEGGKGAVDGGAAGGGHEAVCNVFARWRGGGLTWSFRSVTLSWNQL